MIKYLTSDMGTKYSDKHQHFKEKQMFKAIKQFLFGKPEVSTPELPAPYKLETPVSAVVTVSDKPVSVSKPVALRVTPKKPTAKKPVTNRKPPAKKPVANRKPPAKKTVK